VFLRDAALVSRAPGRVNLIGEHTDYNDGWVLPAAIDFAIWTAFAPRSDRRIRAFAFDQTEEVEFSLDDLPAPQSRHWSNYVIGIAAELERDGARFEGGDLWFAGDVPGGAGLSSSAALEMSIGLALMAGAGMQIDRALLARAGQRAEHHFAGTKCGIMDQFISAHGKEAHALMLDCRSLEYRAVPIPADLRMVICHTGVQHELAGSEYNVRRAQCEEGVMTLKKVLPEIRALRDVTPVQLQQHEGLLPALIGRRCRHVVSENTRVHEFARALEECDEIALGRLMAASHASLRDDFQVSCPELDAMVQAAAKARGVVGARMTGGGFGGCTVNLVTSRLVDEFKASVGSGYERATGRVPRIFVTGAAAGATIVEG
jgi:galactokinase